MWWEKTAEMWFDKTIWKSGFGVWVYNSGFGSIATEYPLHVSSLRE